EQILRSILSFPSTPYFPIGFVDDEPMKQGVVIHGLKVLGKLDDIPQVVESQGVGELIVALPSAGSEAIRKAVEMGRSTGLKKIKIVPSMVAIINGEVSLGALREVQMEDLLGREAVSLDTKSLKNFLGNKTVLITGAAGSIGSELCRQVANFNPSLLLILDQDETGIFNIANELEDSFPRLKVSSIIANIQDEEKINQIFEKFRPSVIFHAAAYKHVPLMEEHPDEAVKNNIFGTKVVAELAIKYGAENFIFVSTDKSVNPTLVMGATKRVGEMICQALNQKNATKFISVRFGNVLDSRGSVIPIFREQIKRGGPVEVTHPEMKRYFMVTSEACLLVMQAGAMGRGGEVFVLDMGEPVKILDLAREMIRLSGFEPDKNIPIVFTGVRPGEKLFEEILTAEEGTIATQNQKIFNAKLSEIDEKKLNQGLENLREAVKKANRKEIVNILKQFIPSYQPNVIV
ncbi:MAG: nucleoside-diphosphate sugar epimerase/dehydratase, partial [bacterium]|nr:nucleoside-diphosphate sugar epimerase/dehydratase [bacterium]